MLASSNGSAQTESLFLETTSACCPRFSQCWCLLLEQRFGKTKLKNSFVLNIFFFSQLVEKTLNPVIVSTLQTLKQNLPGPAFQQAINLLSPELKLKLSELMKQQ